MPAPTGSQQVAGVHRLSRQAGSARSPHRAWLLLILLLAIGLRAYPWLHAHTFRGLQEGDDGIYYGAAKLLLHGQLPYRDLTLVHPPGIAVLLLPFAALGGHAGDDVGLAAARIATVVVATGNVLLLHRLVSRLPAGSPRTAELAALSAAALYAFMPGAVLAEHTVLLEPWVNLFCLLAMTACGPVLAGRPGRLPTDPGRAVSRRLVAAGLALAAALSVKLFAGAYVLALAAGLLAGRPPRTLRTLRPLRSLLVGLTAGLTVLDLPFILAAPHAFWQDVIVTQLSRPADATANGVARLVDMAGVGELPVPVGLALLSLVVLGRLGQLRQRLMLPWLLAGLVAVLAFLRAESYFPHYGAFLAPPIAVLSSRFVAAPASARRATGALRAVTATLVVVFAVTAVRADQATHGQADLRRAGAQVRPGSCLYYEQASAAVAADVLAVPSASCPMWLDGRGALYAASTHWPRSRPFYYEGFTSNTGWQRSTVDQLRHADYLLLSQAPGSIREWSRATRDYARLNFRPELLLGPPGITHVELWSRMGHG